MSRNCWRNTKLLVLSMKGHIFHYWYRNKEGKLECSVKDCEVIKVER